MQRLTDQRRSRRRALEKGRAPVVGEAEQSGGAARGHCIGGGGVRGHWVGMAGPFQVSRTDGKLADPPARGGKDRVADGGCDRRQRRLSQPERRATALNEVNFDGPPVAATLTCRKCRRSSLSDSLTSRPPVRHRGQSPGVPQSANHRGWCLTELYGLALPQALEELAQSGLIRQVFGHVRSMLACSQHVKYSRLSTPSGIRLPTSAARDTPSDGHGSPPSPRRR